MSPDLEFTGERFVPGIAGEIAHEHWHRYAFARRFAAGKRVLDAACGEGYGSALLAGTAAEVVGVDIAEEAVAHARATYAGRSGLRFEQASAAALPLPDASVDLVVSFETLEHLPREDQPRMLAEFARVLTRDGLLLLSAPNPVEYSEARDYRNPFHLHEPSREELARVARRRLSRAALVSAAALLRVRASGARIPRARRSRSSAMPRRWTQRTAAGRDVLRRAGRARRSRPCPSPAPVCRCSPTATTPNSPASTRARARCFASTRCCASAMRRSTARPRTSAIWRTWSRCARSSSVERDAHLPPPLSERNELEVRLVQAGDQARAELASARQAVTALQEEGARLERALAAQERIIAYRQSARWWLALPWLRVKLWWQRVRTP